MSSPLSAPQAFGVIIWEQQTRRACIAPNVPKKAPGMSPRIRAAELSQGMKRGKAELEGALGAAGSGAKNLFLPLKLLGRNICNCGSLVPPGQAYSSDAVLPRVG